MGHYTIWSESNIRWAERKPNLIEGAEADEDGGDENNREQMERCIHTGLDDIADT